MDDKFLYQLREQPNAGFVNQLRKKLQQESAAPKQGLGGFIQSILSNKRLLQAAALMAVLAIIITTISPARALVMSLLANVGGMAFEVTTDYPGDHGDSEETIWPQVMSLDEALAAFPHSIQLPAGLSSEYVLNDKVQVYVGEDAGPFANTIEFEWLSDTNRVSLRVTDRDPGMAEIVAPDALEEITLDETHPAVLIRGGWDADDQVWSNNDNWIRLRWVMDELTYELAGPDQEQLIAIAQSILK